MTQEDKELLIKDLSARLPYGVKISKVVENWTSDPHPIRSINLNNIIVEDGEFEDGTPDIDVWNYEEIKPYLFPLSSITPEQEEELSKLGVSYGEYALHDDIRGLGIMVDEAYIFFEFCYKHHIDFLGLIEMGLAIDATDKNIY